MKNGVQQSTKEGNDLDIFKLIIIPKLQNYIQEIIWTHGEKWKDFILQLKEDYSLKDGKRITKKSFMEWINKSSKELIATELFLKFERWFLQLSWVKKLFLKNNKVELFLQLANNELQSELELLLEDITKDNGLTID